MSSNHILTHRFPVALVAAFVVMAPALGCGSGNGDSAATQAATTNATTQAETANAGAGTSTVAGDRLKAAKATLCPELASLGTDLANVSANGTDAGQDVIARLGALSTALQGVAATLTTAGAADAATAAEGLAANLASLSSSSGDDARALADQAAGQVQKLTDTLRCS